MTTPRIYVGTYAKYNNGSIEGAWLDLEDYSDADAFEEACQSLHADEADPEFMYQDHEGIPEGMISESSLSADFWDWVELDDDDRELLAVYRDSVDQSGDIEAARNAFMGQAASPAEWAEEFLNDTGELADVPEQLRSYIDFESYARDAGYNGMTFAAVDGECWVFNA